MAKVWVRIPEENKNGCSASQLFWKRKYERFTLPSLHNPKLEERVSMNAMS